MNRILTSLIVVLTATNLNAQQISEVPKLVVGITVDQLRGDYLNYLYQAFGEKGFKRLIENGILYENVEFNFNNPDNASAMATLFTGAYPNYNGIIANTILKPTTLRKESVLEDPKFMGNYTSLTVSPKNILTSTLTDELEVASEGLSRIYAIAPDMEQAIIGAGHAASGAFWIDNLNGRWATTTYYKEIPFFVDRYNRTEALNTRIDNLVWEPLLPVSEYNFIPYLSSDWSFKHNFSRIKKDQYKQFKTSALVNDEVNRFVNLFLKNAALGKNNNPDFLSVTYNAGTYLNGSEKQYSLETQDAYLRLDKNIADLLDMIEASVGLKHTFIFLTSTGNFQLQQRPSSRYGIPQGEFRPERCTALLNAYLMVLYGTGNWVSGYHNQQIYLNRKEIEDKKIDIAEIQAKAAEFVIQFSGVQDVVTGSQLLHGNWNELNNQFRNGYHRKLSGDLLIAIQPGWDIVLDSSLQTYKNIRVDGIPAPAIFYGPRIKKQKVTRVIDATEIAPSVAKILRIRSPNACSALPLPEIQK